MEENEVVPQEKEVVEVEQTPAPEAPASDPAPEPAEEPKGIAALEKLISEKSRGKPKADEPSYEPEPIAAKAPAYAADYKFKAWGKEYDVPEKFRSLIKDSDTEKEVKEIFSRFHGLDQYKQKLTSYEGNLKETSTKLGQYEQEANTMKQLYNNDFDAFLGFQGIPENKVLDWAIKKVQYLQATPEQRQMIDSERNSRMQAFSGQQATQTLQQQLLEQQTQTNILGMRMAMQDQEVKKYSDAYDNRSGGKPGDFWDFVCDEGELAYNRKEGTIPPEEAVRRAVNRINGLVNFQMGNDQAQVNQVSTQGNVAPMKKAPPVIPNLGSGSSSPVRQRPKTIEDVEKAAEAFARR